VCIEYGSAGVLRAGGGVEGPERRRHPALPRLHVRELVLRVRTGPYLVEPVSRLAFAAVI